MLLATVVSTAPLEVRLKGDTAVDTPVSRKLAAIPAGLAVGDQVVVVVLDRKVTFVGRWEAVV